MAASFNKIQFAFYARIIGTIESIALPAVAIYNLITSLTDREMFALASYSICVGILISLIEIPSVCKCFKWCTVASHYLRFISGYWLVRGLVYLGICAGGFAIYQLYPNAMKDSLFMLLCYIALVFSCLFYLIAAAKREDAPGSVAQPPSAESKSVTGGGGSAAAGGGGGFFSNFGRKATESAVMAAAPAVASSMGKQMFGGGYSNDDEERGGSSGGGNAPTAPAPVAPAAPAPAAADTGSSKAGMFTGTGLFGGTKVNKYGFSNDTPEANPFMS